MERAYEASHWWVGMTDPKQSARCVQIGQRAAHAFDDPVQDSLEIAVDRLRVERLQRRD
jgi:hypothetical protein